MFILARLAAPFAGVVALALGLFVVMRVVGFVVGVVVGNGVVVGRVVVGRSSFLQPSSPNEGPVQRLVEQCVRGMSTTPTIDV